VNGRAVAVGDDERAVLRCVGRLVVGVELVTVATLLDNPLGAVGVGRGEGGAHVLEPDAVFRQRQRVEIDAHRGQSRAPEDDLADAIDLRKALFEHAAGGVVDLAARHRGRGEGQDQHRCIRRVHLAVGGVAAQARGQVGAGGIDRRLDVARGAVDVAVEPELQGDARLADGADRGHFGDVRDLAEMAFERARDTGRDGVGTGARQRGVDRDGGEVDLRQRRDRQLGVGEEAGERDADREQGRRDGAGDERGGEVHAGGLPSVGSGDVAPGLSRPVR
jgi:hypothetical protein